MRSESCSGLKCEVKERWREIESDVGRERVVSRKRD